MSGIRLSPISECEKCGHFDYKWVRPAICPKCGLGRMVSYPNFKGGRKEDE